MKPKLHRILILSFLFVFCYGKLNAQVTTAAIIGSVKDAKKEALIGAVVVATHTPSGSKYGAATVENGKFHLVGLRIGGPYSLKVTYGGYQDKVIDNIFLTIDQKLKLDIVMEEGNIELKEITINSNKNAIINSGRTGASTVINNANLVSLPTLSRNLNDFIRLTPQASGLVGVSGGVSNAASLGGMDNRFNNISLDGSIFNNSFGLAPTPGGQTNASPVSMDAIEQIQVSLAPYDVRQGGFVGAGINAVTRSGTNEFKGSVFYNMRNQSFVGTKANNTDVLVNNFDVGQYGFRVGGPLIKDKLFFFLNGEQEKRTDPGTTYLAKNGVGDTLGTNTTRVYASDLDSLRNFLSSKYGYNAGAYQGYLFHTTSTKFLARIDYNINNRNKLSFRYNQLKSLREIPVSNSGGFNGRRDNLFALNFENNNYVQNNDLYSAIAELNSNINSKMSNNVVFGFTKNNDYRTSNGGVFPLVDILSGGRNYTSFGYEPFTPNNALYTSTWQFQDNLTYFMDKHTLTAGLAYENFKFENTFTPTYYGQFVYNSLSDFYRSAAGDTSVTPNKYTLTYSALPGGALPTATTKVSQTSIYLQDEWEVMDNLKVTGGIRVDIPIYGNTALNNPKVEALSFIDPRDNSPINVSTSKLPKTNPLYSPRVGFNWDVNGNKKTQVRGGTGVFTGRPSFVFISNQVGNNGILTGQISAQGTAAKPYVFSPDVTKYIPANASTPATYNIAVTDPNFKFPQVWRNNLAVDQQLPWWSLIGSVELIYTKNLNNIVYYNLNQRTPNDTSRFAGADNRVKYPGTAAKSYINGTITDATYMTNTNQGYAYSLTFKLERQIEKGIGAMLAYNYGVSKDLMSAGSIAYSSWSQNLTVNGNNSIPLAYSNNDQRHRVIGYINYRKEYAKKFATQVTLFMEARNLGRFSYVYSGDMNGDGISGNDLMYIPRNQSEMNFSAITGSNPFSVQQQKDAFESYITNDKYLNAHRGEYAERNGALLPWVKRFDVSIIQEFFMNVKGKRNSLQLRADIFNAGNLFNKAWGVSQIPNNSSPLIAKGVDASNHPLFQMATVNNSLNYSTFRDGNSLSDVWQLQLGIRYIFN